MDFRIVSFVTTLALVVIPVSARVCVLGTEPDSSAGGMVRAVMPPGDPCTCTVIVPGGHNMYAPPRPDPPTYIDIRHLIAADAGEIWRLFNCVAGNTPDGEPLFTDTAQDDSTLQDFTHSDAITEDSTSLVDTVAEESTLTVNNVLHDATSLAMFMVSTVPQWSTSRQDITAQKSTLDITPTNIVDTTTQESTTLADTHESTLDTTSQVFADTTHQESTAVVETTTHEESTTLATTYADCQEILDAGHTTSGVYTILLNNAHIPVYCSMEGSLGYIMFQRRIDGSVKFDRNWQEYADGFGDVAVEFWLGNEKLKTLTAAGTWELTIIMKNFAGEEATVTYGQFSITDPNYKLYVHSFTEVNSGPGESLQEHSGWEFSTADSDNDDETNENCAQILQSGWWFKSCDPKSNLNGPYSHTEAVAEHAGIHWETWMPKEKSLKECEMKIRRTS